MFNSSVHIQCPGTVDRLILGIGIRTNWLIGIDAAVIYCGNFANERCYVDPGLLNSRYQ